MVGRTLGHYRVLEKVGEGGMGEVYLAEDSKLERKIALKVLPADVASDPDRLSRFEREAKAVAALNHPNIVHVYSVEEADGAHFITMELVEGESLDQVIPSGGLPLEKFFDLAIPLADALFEAHTQGIVHRDLKPNNIMVDRKGRPKILDFGLAKLRAHEVASVLSEAPTEVMTQEGQVLGTYPYMSPEQAEGGEVDQRSDLFSFGIVLYEMVSGERPFQGDSPVSLISSILKDEPQPLFEFRSDLPVGLDEILSRCLEKHPAARFSSAVELQRELEELHQSVESGIAVPLAAEAGLPAFLIGTEAEEPAAQVFVGREQELVTLDEHLARALEGQGQIVFITGEAGTGKTALADAFVRQAQEGTQSLVVASGGCSSHTGPGDPYAPFRQVLAQLTGDVEALWRAGALTRHQAIRLWELMPKAASSIVDSGADLVETLVPGEGLLRRAESAAARGTTWLFPLKSLVERKLALPPDVMLQQSAIFGQGTRLLQDLATESPLLLLLEDLHWSDTGSVDLLSHLSRQLAGHRILIVGTFRPSEVSAGRGEERHPLEAVVHEIERSFGECQVHLGQEAELSFVDDLIDSEPNHLNQEFRRLLYARTQGHALFTVELLRNMQARGVLVEDEDGFWVEGSDLDWKALPAQVDGVISERIGRLSADLRELLKVASVEGENFTAEVLARIQKADTRETVRLLSQELERRHRLVTAEGLKRINSNRLSLYRFLHALFQKYLYDELDEAERAYLHEDVGTALEELFEEQAEEIAAQLARHFEEAGVLDKAVRYRAVAGRRAVSMAANQEAISHYRRALDLLAELPPSPERNDTELDLQVAINLPLTMTEGWSATGVGAATSRALELSDALGGDPRALAALWFRASYSAATGNMPEAVEESDRMLQIAQGLGDDLQEAMAHWTAGLYRGFSGQLLQARQHFERTESFYDPESHSHLALFYGIDPGAAAKVHLGWVLARLGYLDQSRGKCDEAITLARSLGHPHTLCFTLGVAAVSDWLRYDWESTRSHAEESLELATEHGFFFMVGMDRGLQGLAIANMGAAHDGIQLIQAGIGVAEKIRSLINRPMFLEFLATAYLLADEPEKALQIIDKGMDVAEETGELKYKATLPIVKAAILENAGELEEAEDSLLTAISESRAYQAKLIELKASTSLARMWHRQGKQVEAKDLLSSVYGWFTEGLGEAPLKEARAVLEELS